jgi:hypothetical protein
VTEISRRTADSEAGYDEDVEYEMRDVGEDKI